MKLPDFPKLEANPRKFKESMYCNTLRKDNVTTPRNVVKAIGLMNHEVTDKLGSKP
ncbi:14107_t:CDS:2 [Dentiscutata erythropus]|uniref:14107_t:CDS:1 n=1 Tax=Dentiscutata erythropus TaxID=1348616 RepID=A0A9N8ZRZ6_9GLOM|nr:14107_t:CDS:2 [Dentiscutata erythropus]